MHQARLFAAFWTLAALTVGCSSAPAAVGDEVSGRASAQRLPGQSSIGATLFARHCAACHGDYGAADGSASAHLFPAARDFTTGRFRLVGTDNGAPSDDDLQRTLRRGIPGSAMPSWSWLGDAELQALVAYTRDQAVEGLALNLERSGLAAAEASAEARARMTPGADLSDPGPIDSGPAALMRGRRLYEGRCASCHGDDGTGIDEPRYDEGGELNWPRDLRAGHWKGGATPADLARRIRAGMPGSAMPPAQFADPDDLRALVAYVSSLVPPGSEDRLVQRREQLVARRVTELPSQPEGAPWSAAEEVQVVLAPLWWKDAAIVEASLAALHDGERLAVRLRWRDDSPDPRVFTDSRASDAAALQFTRAGGSPPLMGMGSREHPTDLWHWRASRFEDRAGALDLTPHPLDETLRSEARVDARSYHPGSERPEVSTDADELEGRGVGLAVPKTAQEVNVAATWDAGVWSVLFTRDFAGGEGGVSFVPGSEANIAVALWNGAAGDYGGQKSSSIWQALTLAP